MLQYDPKCYERVTFQPIITETPKTGDIYGSETLKNITEANWEVPSDIRLAKWSNKYGGPDRLYINSKSFTQKMCFEDGQLKGGAKDLTAQQVKALQKLLRKDKP